MDKEHKIWLETVKIESKPTTIYTSTYENKEVRIYSIDSKICINWYIDGKLIEKAIFPKEIITEMELFFQTIYAKYIDKHLMYEILNTMKRYLPYLEDVDKKENNWLKHIKIEGEIII
jgi:hypothetical protein